MVIEANASTDPWAVMVHFQHAPVTDAAVVRPGRLELFALLAKPPCHEVFEPAKVLKITVSRP